MKKSLLLIPALLLFAQATYAQKSLDKQAEKLYNHHVYDEAAKIYSYLLQENYSYDYNLKLAVCYEKLNRPTDAAYWYAQLVRNQTPPDPEILLHYAYLLKSNGKYVSAKQIFLQYAKYNNDGYYLAGTCDYALNNQEQTASVYIDTCAINSTASDLGPAFFGKKIIFASSRINDKNETAQFYDLYITDENQSQPKPLKLNTTAHEASAVFDNFRDELYFTSNNFNNGRTIPSQQGNVNLQLYTAKHNRGKWRPIRPFAFNAKNYSVGQPALSPDATVLFFVSDMPGGYGGTDIYYSVHTTSGWGEPVNIGPVINTKGNEMFPFLSDDGKLYFASNWHPGYGGLDIFICEREQGNWSNPKNAGLPLNSSQDDFALILKQGAGYFSSNRTGGKGDDDIYKCYFLKLIVGVFVSDQNHVPVANAAIQLIEPSGKTIAGVTDENGLCTLQMETGKSYTLQVQHSGFLTFNYSHIENANTVNGYFPVQLNGLMGSQEVVPEKELPVPDHKQDIAPQTTDGDVYTYELQIGVFKNPDYTKISSLTTYGELSVKSRENGLLSFSLINLLSNQDAVKAKEAAHQTGFTDAYIITYKNGIKQN